MINSKGKWWKGENFEDLKKYLSDLYKQDAGNKLRKILQSKCSCGSSLFVLIFEKNEGIAKRICVECKQEHFICDSGKYWEDALKESKPIEMKCPECKNKPHELAVGFEYRKEGLFKKGDIKWIIIGARCYHCGLLSSPVDWKIDYSPTNHLEKQI